MAPSSGHISQEVSTIRSVYFRLVQLVSISAWKRWPAKPAFEHLVSMHMIQDIQYQHWYRIEVPHEHLLCLTKSVMLRQANIELNSFICLVLQLQACCRLLLLVDLKYNS